MTGYTVHTGSTIKFSTGWDLIFQGKKAEKKSPVAAPVTSVQAEKTPKKVAKPSAKKSAAKAGGPKMSQIVKKKAAAKGVKRGK